MYIISRCLTGVNCKYNAGNNRSQGILEFCEKHSYITVCPETSGKLPAPRPPAELDFNENGMVRVMDKEGKDLTEAFKEGTRISLECIKEEAEKRGEKIEGAILKANSPSCGYDKIYDGTFTGIKINGDGVFGRELRKMGVKVANEKNFTEIFRGK